VNVLVDGQKVEQVHQFKYLGSIIEEEGRCLVDVKARIGMAKNAFNNRKELLCRRMSKELKKKIVKTLVWPVALYGCETWTLRDAECKRLDAFEMWVWRRMEKVSYKDRVTNEEVLKNVGESRCLLDKIRSRKRNWVGHVLRGEGLMREVMEGRMDGKRTRGRPRKGMLDEFLEDGSYAQMKRRAHDRESWRSWMPWTCPRAEH
jgi:hypothetical protein